MIAISETSSVDPNMNDYRCLKLIPTYYNSRNFYSRLALLQASIAEFFFDNHFGH